MHKAKILLVIFSTTIVITYIAKKWLGEEEYQKKVIDGVKFTSRVKAFVLAIAWMSITAYLVMYVTKTI